MWWHSPFQNVTSVLPCVSIYLVLSWKKAGNRRCSYQMPKYCDAKISFFNQKHWALEQFSDAMATLGSSYFQPKNIRAQIFRCPSTAITKSIYLGTKTLDDKNVQTSQFNWSFRVTIRYKIWQFLVMWSEPHFRRWYDMKIAKTHCQPRLRWTPGWLRA